MISILLIIAGSHFADLKCASCNLHAYFQVEKINNEPQPFALPEIHGVSKELDFIKIDQDPDQYVRLIIYEKEIWKKINPTNRNEAHLSFVANQNWLHDTKSNLCENTETEANLTDLFRGQSRELIFPEIEMVCDEGTSCVSDYPSVFFSIQIPTEQNCFSFLVTGDSSMSTVTEPQKDDLPRTIWIHEEPVSNLHWAGEFTSPNGTEFVFVASLINPELKLDSLGRVEIAQKIIETLTSTKR